MSNFRILKKNIAQARHGCSIAASPSMLSTLSEDNLILPPERERTGRSTSLATQVITLDWPDNQKCGLVAVCQHNLTTSGTLRHVGLDGASATIFDTGADPAFVTTGLDTDVDDYTDDDFRIYKNTAAYVDEVTTLRSLQVTADDGSNADGFMEALKIMAGPYLEVTYNPGGIEVTPRDYGIGGAADDGSDIVDKGYKRTVITVSLEFVTDADAAKLIAIARYLGRDGETFIDCYPGAASAKGVYGRGCFRLVESPTFGSAIYGHQRTTLRFESV